MAEFVLNGSPAKAGDDHPHLLSALRDELGVTSPKDGCSPTGQCGCCTVLIDGKARVACQISMDKVEGTAITTVEGLDPVERDRYASAFAASGALQCGFCTPGIVMRTKSLIDKKGSSLTREEASRHLGGNLCRCTGYTKILDAVEALASGNIPVMVTPGGIGSRGVKYESCQLAIGMRPYIDDMNPDGCLHAALHFSEHARADIVAIDATAALAVAGVHAVYTAADIPGELRVGIIHTDWPVMIPVGGRTSYLGDVLAIVVADTREIARAAAAEVRVEYTVHPPMTDPVTVMHSDEPAVWQLDGNVLSKSVYRRGDVDAALEQSAHVVNETFQTQRIEHAFLEPESTLAVPTDDGRSARLLGWSGRVGRPQPDRVGARRRPRPGDGRAGLERRRVRWQGGHGEPGPHRARRLAAAATGEVHAVARGVAADAPEAPSDPDGVHGRLRRRREAHGRAGADVR